MRATNRYGAWVGFFPVAREVVGTPSFEGYDLVPKPGHDFDLHPQLYLFESQDNGTGQHESAAKPLVPR